MTISLLNELPILPVTPAISATPDFAALIARVAFNAGTVADLVFSTAIWRV